LLQHSELTVHPLTRRFAIGNGVLTSHGCLVEKLVEIVRLHLWVSIEVKLENLLQVPFLTG